MRSVSRIAAVHLYALPLECVFDEECISQRPCAVRTEVNGRFFLIGLSDVARQLGLRPNMTQSEGRARLADLLVKSRQTTREVERLHAAAELLMAFGPHVEVGPPNLLWVEIGRGRRELAHRLGDTSEEAIARAILNTFEKVGHRVTLAIAADPSTARTWAQHLVQRRWAEASPQAVPLRRRQRARGPVSPRARRTESRRSGRWTPTIVVPSHQTDTMLGGLPLDALLWTDKHDDPDGSLRSRLQEVAASLRLLGVTDVARLASLPAAQIASRFGDAGALLARRAVGADTRPLRPFVPPERLAEAFEFEAVTDDLEPVLFVLRRLFVRLEARLEARGLATTEMQLHFLIEPDPASQPQTQVLGSSRRTVTLPIALARPTRSTKTLLAVAREKLGGQLPGAVWSVEVEAQAPTVDRGAQLDLFNAHARRVEDVGQLISRLQTALGSQALFSPRLEDTHRPEAAWSPVPFDIERALAEPTTVKSVAAPAKSVEPPAFSDAQRFLYALPTVNDHLSVTGFDAHSDPCLGAHGGKDAIEVLVKTERPWPKPVARHQDDEPLPPLPPRPLALFEPPEPVFVLSSNASPSGEAKLFGERDQSLAGLSGLDEGVLVWRGRRHHLVTVTGSEHLDAEWWMTRPVDRAYFVAEGADGRRFWLFLDPRGEAYIHGVFD